MTKMKVSEKGQITIPAELRRRTGIKRGSEVAIEVREGALVITPLRSISDVAGIFRDRVHGKSPHWDRARAHAEEAVARQVADEQ